jgi:cell division protein FtsB
MARGPRVSRFTEGIAEWLGSLRFSVSTLVLVGLLIAGVLIVSPSMSAFVQQSRQISELSESVRLSRESVDSIDQERTKWNDPAYIRAQARDRLFYVMPGETQLSVIDDVIIPTASVDEPSAELLSLQRNWAVTLTSSVMMAGAAEQPPEESSGTTSSDDLGVKESAK